LARESSEEMAMSLIGPRLTPKELKATATATMKGDGLKAALPGVAADAHSMDKKAYQVNRDLAKRIQQLVAELKPSDSKVPRFVLGFRMYPSAESKYWDKAVMDHVCGCGCGCSSSGNGYSAPALKKSAKKSSAKKGSAPRRSPK
jgi:hypothetical protein